MLKAAGAQEHNKIMSRFRMASEVARLHNRCCNILDCTRQEDTCDAVTLEDAHETYSQSVKLKARQCSV